MDYIEELETYDELKYEQKLTRDLLDLLALEREKAIADYVQNPLNFDSSSQKYCNQTSHLMAAQKIL